MRRIILVALDMSLIGAPFFILGYGITDPSWLTKLTYILISTTIFATSFFIFFTEKGGLLVLKGGFHLGKAQQFINRIWYRVRYNLNATKHWRNK